MSQDHHPGAPETSGREVNHARARAKLRGWRAWLLLFFTSALLAVAFEVGLRVYATSTNKVRGATYDNDLGWRMLPGITKAGHQWCDQVPAKTNTLGWRDTEFSRMKGEKGLRIVALGDSFTFGHGVDYGDRFSEVLERRRESLEVYNMGVSAYGTDQQVRVYEVHGSRLDPDGVLLMVFLGNDLEDIMHERRFSWPKPYFRLQQDQLELVEPRQDWSTFLRTKSYFIEALFQIVEGRNKRHTYAADLATTDPVRLFLKLVDRLSDQVEANDAKLLVALIHPRNSSEEQELVARSIAQSLSDAGHAVLDLGEPFARESASGKLLYLSDGHWNAQGNALAAELIESKLLSEGWIR